MRTLIIAGVVLLAAPAPCCVEDVRQELDLAGTWSFRIDLEGVGVEER